MNESIIKVKNISKKYNISHQQDGYVSLREVLTNVLKHPLHFVKKKVTAPFRTKEEFWALKDISFEVKRGEVVGIIGKNGAGKSTLLKILSQITPPTTGEIKINGKVGSLLEVGTGFHPELTGRENTFLNGAILGMTKKEITKKFDQIVEFAGIEKFLDTPVKRYSSGMQVRLAFSIAAHMEPEILIIDEVLSVGDAEFQKKSLEKMESITQKEGRTILLVSHNLITVQQLCKKTILLEKGEIKAMGETKKIIDMYLNDKPIQEKTASNILPLAKDNHLTDLRLTGLKISNTGGSTTIRSNDKLKIELDYNSDRQQPINDARIVIEIISKLSGQTVLRLDSDVAAETLANSIEPRGKIVCETGSINLSEGTYAVDINLVIEGTSRDYTKNAGAFAVRTNLGEYGYKTFPDNSVCDYVIKYNFKQ